MIYSFKITSPEAPKFLRIIEANPFNTFFDLHCVIQQACSFDSDQLASFFLIDQKLKKTQEITLLDMGDKKINQWVMNRIKINDLIHHTGQRCIYVFDFFNDRFYFVELMEISMEKNLNFPMVTFEQGNAPAQIYTQDVDLLDAPTPGFSEYQDFGELEDYSEIFGETDDFLGRSN